MRLSRRAFCACFLCGLAAPRAFATSPTGASGQPAPSATVPPATTAPPLAPFKPGSLKEPRLHVEKGGQSAPRVALTLDACSGQTDRRILDVLMAEEIPATIFVTGRWIRRNAEALALMAGRPDLFEIENHGLNHVPAIDRPGSVYGIETAGSTQAVVREVEEGAKWITGAGLAPPRWFRGATALYTASSMATIEALGYRIAGYSLNADDGASVAARTALRRIAAAHDGDVIIAHVNQPSRPAGAGVAEGLAVLKKRGAVFVKLGDLSEPQLAAVAKDG
ncbi:MULTISPECIES: polysaccharide deacetylase family protein [Alphaproteobacteria]|uniref:Chitooligosaccharide deacetylase n=2 Tax=Alphaproteobacteria TaxID=28211 RepID=A0A512HFS6_9HYPH|nr:MULTISPECIES: polysaccharide deacetylase family protein [Alphaproteobacteria]GEO84299.1 hypothetical protein RNA01_12310 [Ciceribacter naphthalenivorans]GLR24835.1 hypothetical protein GCM10007920_46290 [Ciceribacter naphthalenivorans]GLT07691.1 hypothetical protein GCM10007926_46290 [Sphingomonas psychrolutea]